MRGPDRLLAGVDADEIATALAELWGSAAAATWNRNRASVGSWLTWCADKKNWTAPALPAAAERRREHGDDTKAVARSRIDRLCRRRDVPLREKTLWRMLYETAARAAEMLSLDNLCPETGRARLGYDRARILLGHHADGLELHPLRHSSATHLGDANTSANVIMAKTGHKSLRSVQRYVQPGLVAVHTVTETRSSPRRRG